MADAEKNDLKPWLQQQGGIPPKQSAAFVTAREDVLDIYAQPYDPRRPVVCIDEVGKPLIGDVRLPLPVRRGSPAKQDREYSRGSMANLLMVFEFLAGQRDAAVTERKTSVDFVALLRRRADEW